jgi:hypothetical protein
VAIQRVLRNTQRVIEANFYVGTTLTDADGAVTVTITRGDGTVFATDAATTKPGSTTGKYRYTLIPQANLERFTFDFKGTFSGVEQHHPPVVVEIVGAVYVSLNDIRALDGLANTTAFPDETLREVRDAFEDLAERHCGVAFVPRYRHEWHWGRGDDYLYLRHTPLRRLLAVKMDGVAQTFTGWTVEDGGTITRDTGLFVYRDRVEVTYEHGYDEPDAELRQAALRAIRKFCLGNKSGIPDNAISMTTPEGGFTLGIAGDNRPTGDPFVDGVLNRLRRKSPAGAPLVG